MLTFIISDNNVHYYVLSLTHIIFDMDASLNKRITHFPATREPVGLVIRSDEKRPDGVTFIPWEGGMCLTWDAIVSSTPWQSRTAPDLPRQRVLLLKLQQRGNRPSIPQFYLRRPTALCPWPSKLLAPSITKAWFSLIILATASHKLLETAGRLHLYIPLPKLLP